MPTRNSLFVDTSWWASYIDKNDPWYRQTRAAYQRAVAKKRRLITTSYIVTEFVALLESRTDLPRQNIFNYVDTIQSSAHIEVLYLDQHIHMEAWNLLKARPDKEWSLVDASSFVVMQQLGLTEALTTDHHFTQAGFTRLPEPQP